MLASISKPYVAVMDGITSKSSGSSRSNESDCFHSGWRGRLIGHGTI